MTSISEFEVPIGITVGDMAGVGPELVLRNWNQLTEYCSAVIYGDIRWLREAAAALAVHGYIESDMATRMWAVSPSDVRSVLDDEAIPVVHTGGETEPKRGMRYPWGQAVADFGLVQYRALQAAIKDAQDERISAIVTCPWHKSRLQSVGLPASGHTEVLAKACDVDEVVMMLAGDTLRVGLATVHISIADVPKSLTKDLLVSKGRVLHQGLRELYGLKEPVIAFCGLNPHAGESGTIGTEEQDIIRPAIMQLQQEGVRATGPYPADTLFPMFLRDRLEADAIFAMYHDQGLGPLKTYHLGESMNTTLGLPIIRTSVDHGTAYDLAGKGEADGSSLVYAFKTAAAFVKKRATSRSHKTTSEAEAIEDKH